MKLIEVWKECFPVKFVFEYFSQQWSKWCVGWSQTHWLRQPDIFLLQCFMSLYEYVNKLVMFCIILLWYRMLCQVEEKVKFIHETIALGFSRSLLRLSPILPLYVYLYIHIHLKHAFLFSSTLQILIQKVRPLTLMIVILCLKATAVMTVHMKTCRHSLIYQKVSFIQFLNNFISWVYLFPSSIYTFARLGFHLNYWEILFIALHHKKSNGWLNRHTCMLKF